MTFQDKCNGQIAYSKFSNDELEDIQREIMFGEMDDKPVRGPKGLADRFLSYNLTLSHKCNELSRKEFAYLTLALKGAE